MTRWLATRRSALLLILVLTVGAALRLYGLNWDGGHWLHPDERQIYFITAELAWPDSLAQALSPDSPLNPGFFAYGSLPFYLLKIVSLLLAPLWPALRDPDNLHLAGRPLAALFDLGTVLLTYRLARRISVARNTALLAAALVSLAVLGIQVAHFYAVDPLLTFFVMLTLNLAVDVAQGRGRHPRLALGISLGLALATKVSAGPLALVVFAAYYLRLSSPGEQRGSGRSRVLAALGGTIRSLLVAAVVFVVVQPYALIDWQTFLGDTIRESQIAWGTLDAPYTRQYAGTLPYLYSIRQTALWALALPAGVLVWLGLAAGLVRWLRRAPWGDTLLLAWAVPYLALTGLLYARYLRYMQPALPVLCILGALLLARPWRQQTAAGSGSPTAIRRRAAIVAGSVFVLLSLAYAFFYSRIYAEPHTWITASEWLYDHAPAGSTLAVEDWDVSLPLPLEANGQSRRIEEYETRTLRLYDEPDDAAKWQLLAADLADSDYLIVASRRLYGSIPRSPERYPVSTRYYEQLFAGHLGFKLAAEFERGPGWLNPRVAPLPGAAPRLLLPDESFVVYDHPRTLVFANTGRLAAQELLRRLGVQ